MTGQEDRPPAAANVPLSRAGDAREVGSLIAWLVSDEASYVTGSSYVIDGGLMLTAAEQQ
jgi:NAD(P)-dependent dehydrogenase (short-subunit alcohol dehydrogenase family)